MAGNRTYAAIGGFIIGVLVLVTVGVLIFGGTQVFSHKRQAVIFFNQSVLGLSKGGRVLFRGVQIGTVKNVELRVDPKANHARIAVTISMTNQAIRLNGTRRKAQLGIKQLVKRGLRAQLVVYSYVTSELAVNLSFKPHTSIHYAVNPSKVPLPEIPATQSKISKIKNKVVNLPWQQTLQRVNNTMQSMIDLSHDLDNTVEQLQPELQQATHTTNKTLSTVQKAVKDNNQQLQKTMQQVKQLAHSANQLTAGANSQLKARGQQLDKVLKNARETTQKLNQLTSNLNSLVAPGNESRGDIKNILRDLSASAANLKDFTQTIERNPHALIYGGSH